MQKSTENVAKSPKFCTLIVQMLLTMAVNAAICSTFEVQYVKSTSTRTTAIGYLGYL